MIFCSYNTRGLNNKISFYKDFIASNRLSLIALLETHVKKENSIFVSKLVAPHFEWLFNYDHHSNGRIWIGWNPCVWTISDPVFHAQHISCKISLLASMANFFASFIYAFNDNIERRILWKDLLEYKGSFIGTNVSPWLITGDFNVCLHPVDMNNSNIVTADMREFRDAVDALDVFDLNFTGKLYTWWDCSHNSPVFRKLDRVLVNTDWVTVFPFSGAHFLPRGLSDHSPAMITLGVQTDKLHKPFQIFQHMIDHKDFLCTVNEAWNVTIRGDPWYILSSKIKRVKAALKRLNKFVGNVHEDVITARTTLLNFQTNLPPAPSFDDFHTEEQLCSALHKALSVEETFLKQKSRVKWLDLGDGNNAFFHRACKSRWNTNKIVAIEDSSGNIKTSHGDIATVAVDYFRRILGSSHQVDVLEPDITLPSLSDLQQSFLNAPFCRADVLSAFKSMGKRKSPGPDGLTPEFYLAAWDIVGEDVTNGILYFFDSCELPRIVNSVAITLIPKCCNPSKIEEYRPISCCNTLYKCITKLLASRIQRVLPQIISHNQSAFVPQRLIGDNIMLVQALCRDYHRNDGTPRCAFKLDLHKAFDSLNWSFLFDIMAVY